MRMKLYSMYNVRYHCILHHGLIIYFDFFLNRFLNLGYSRHKCCPYLCVKEVITYIESLLPWVEPSRPTWNTSLSNITSPSLYTTSTPTTPFPPPGMWMAEEERGGNEISRGSGGRYRPPVGGGPWGRSPPEAPGISHILELKIWFLEISENHFLTKKMKLN